MEWATETRYEALPEAVVTAAKAYLLNTAAAILAGSGAPGAREVAEQVRRWGGAPESTVAVYGFKAPAPLAALANGIMAHAMDFDDTQAGTGFHPNVSIVPALLAVAETTAGASGCELLAAHVAALEVSCRMTLAARNQSRHPWLTTTLFGVFGAAVAAGKLLGLAAPVLRHAIGIAYSSAGGNRQGLLDGTLIQRVQPGLCAQAGVAAACFAQSGVTGALDVLEGRYGLYPSYYRNDYSLESIASGLGQEFRMLDLALKPYPCCSYSQEPIESALALAQAHDFAPRDIEEVVVSVVSEHAARLVDRPFRPRSCPQVDAQFSLQYVVAVALCRKALGLEAFQEAAFADSAVLALADRVRVSIDPLLEGNVEVRLRNGKNLTNRVPRARGHPSRPFSTLELVQKLRDCGAHAVVARSKAQIDAIETAVFGLEKSCGGEFAALLG